MKKLLFVTLFSIAAMVLTAPGFGSTYIVVDTSEYSFNETNHILTFTDTDTDTNTERKFTFDNEVNNVSSVLKITIQGQGGNSPGKVINAISDAWNISTELFHKHGNINSNSVDFSDYVEIVEAKWGGSYTYAFLLDGYTKNVTWDFPNNATEISHVAGYNTVPIPGAAWLLGSGMVGLLALRRRRISAQ
jgi:hypothetical protein